MEQLPFIIIMVGEALVIIFLIIMNVRLNKDNKNNDSFLSAYKEKLREDELDAAIGNPYHKPDKAKNDWKNAPYDVEFKDENAVRTTSAICMHVVCIGRLVTKKYIINVYDELYLGRAKQNGIVFDEMDIDQKQIHFVRQQGELYIQNVSSNNPAVFIRNDAKYELTDSLVKLNNGDKLKFRDSLVVIHLI